jgi:hypothetical protein
MSPADDRPPPDISLAVRDGARRLSYAELAAVRGISRASAERLVRRRRWPRQLANDGVVRVLVPLSEAVPERAGRGKRIAPDSPPPIPGPDIPRLVRETMESLVTPLVALVERERTRADDAVAAERIAAGAAAALRAELDRRREWRLFRRLCWALRGDRRP